MVSAVAIGLFMTRGFDATTVDDIATALGVGRRTVFRYFPSKNDMVWGDFDLVVERLRRDLREQDPETPIMQAISNAVISSNAYPAEELDELRARITLITRLPTLQAHAMLRYGSWRSAVTEFAAQRSALPPDAIWPQAVGFASLATSIAAFTVWSASNEDLGCLLRAAFEALQTGFVP